VDSIQKALEINLNSKIYGSLAEIGAGQEVARVFFRAGGAAGTVAKTMSAYDMTYSDIIYGKDPQGRYVSKSRVTTMLGREYELLIDRLDPTRGETSTFFTFANTVAARSYKGGGVCHGWLGVRFQHSPKSPASQVVIHINLMDSENLQQQEAIGLLGVNLIYAAFDESRTDPKQFVSSIMEGLGSSRIEIDVIQIEGPAFESQDGRLYSLQLIKSGMTKAIVFDKNGGPVQASDHFYKKNILICRGSFRPPTLVNIDMLDTGKEAFLKDLKPGNKEETLVLAEVSMNKLLQRGEDLVDSADFLARVDLLAALGQSALITNFDMAHQIQEYIAPFSRKALAFVMGFYNLELLLDSKAYENSSIGPLEAWGRLAKSGVKIYVYPAKEAQGEGQEILNSKKLPLSESFKHLYNYLSSESILTEIENFNPEILHIWSRQVLKMIQENESGWEEMVPEVVKTNVKKHNLFNK
jgi:hypothetical protein